MQQQQQQDPTVEEPPYLGRLHLPFGYASCAWLRQLVVLHHDISPGYGIAAAIIQ